MFDQKTSIDFFEACSTDCAFKEFTYESNGKSKQDLYKELKSFLKEFYYSSRDAQYSFEDQQKKMRRWIAGTVDFKHYGLDWSGAMKALHAVYADCPLLFFSELYKTGGSPQGGFISPIVDPESVRGDFRRFYAEKIEEEIICSVSDIPAKANCREKAKMVYDKIRKTARYDYNKGSGQLTSYPEIPSHSILNYVRTRSAVCQGFARTYQAMMNYLSIPAISISILTDSGIGHSANMIYLSDEQKWIIVDVTVGVSIQDDGGFDIPKGVYQRNLNTSVNEFYQYKPRFDHIWEQYIGGSFDNTSVSTH